MPESDVFAAGEVARIALTIRDEAGVLVDPATISWEAILPDSSPVTRSISDFVNDSPGNWHYDYVIPDVVGHTTWHATTSAPMVVFDGGWDTVPSPESATLLVDPTQYARITGDTATSWADAAQALGEAIRLVEETCKRTFGYGTYTETLDIWGDGVVYPAASPVESVSSPSSSQLRLGGIYVGGSVTWKDGFSPLPAQSEVTYTGGYHPFGSTQQPSLPVKLARVIARIAYLMLHPNSVVGSGVPAGAKSAAVGDVSVAGDLSAFVIADPSIEKDLHRFTRRRAAQLTRGW